MAPKSIKSYFLNEKSHKSGYCREDQIEKNATVPNQIEQENASEAKQHRIDGDAHKNHNDIKASQHGKNASKKNPRGLVQGI